MPTVRGEITVKVSQEAAYRFLLDCEKVIRLSPYWEVKAYRGAKTPAPGAVAEAEVEHYRDGRQEALTFTLIEAVPWERIRWAVAGGTRREIAFFLKEEDGGIRIVQEEELVCPPEDDAVRRRGESELTFWLRSLREYLRLYERSTLWTRAFRWVMDRYWLPMTPSQRKVSILVIKITIAEFVIFLGIVLAFILAGVW